MVEASDTPKRIRVIAAVIVDSKQRVLLVRKAGSSYFMQPGGKPEPGEFPLDTLAREITEELGCEIDRENAEHFGSFEAPAANEPDCLVKAELYRASLFGDIETSGEIEEVQWISPHNLDGVRLAPLTAEHVLPRL